MRLSGFTGTQFGVDSTEIVEHTGLFESNVIERILVLLESILPRRFSPRQRKEGTRSPTR